MCRPGELTAKYFASKTCLISFLKPFQWRWNCLVSVYYLTPGGFHNGHQNRWVVTDTSWSLAVAVHTRGSIPTAEFLFFSDLGRMILEPEIRMDHYILFLIYQFKCIAVTWGLFGIFNRGKKVFKNYTLQPRIQWAGHINYEYILYFCRHSQNDFMWEFFQIRGNFRNIFSVFWLCLFLSFRCLLYFSSPFYKYTHAGIPLVFNDLEYRIEHAE